MARTDEPNSGTTHFFILVGPGSHLDSKFSAFGTVTKGMEVADAINQAPVEGEKPEKPVRDQSSGCSVMQKVTLCLAIISVLVLSGCVRPGSPAAASDDGAAVT